MPAIKAFCHRGTENAETNKIVFSVFSVPLWQIWDLSRAWPTPTPIRRNTSPPCPKHP